MPHVSKRKLKKDVYSTLTKRFGEMLFEIIRTKNPSAFTNELLTNTERLMLCKRLIILVMISEHYPFLEIEKVLKVTTQTIGRVYGRMKNGEFNELLGVIEAIRVSKSNTFWQIFNILPQRVGTGRYQHWLHNKHPKQKLSPIT